MPRFRDQVEVLWPATRLVGGVEVDDWGQEPDRVLPVRATVHPAETTQRGVDADPVLARSACYLPPGTEISPRCRVRWNGTLYAIAGDVDTWRTGTRVRYLHVTLTKALGVTAAHQLLPESLMTALAAFRVPGGTRGAFNATTGSYAVTPHAPYLTDVPCELEAMTTAPRDVEAAGEALTVLGYRLLTPLATTGVEIGHLVTVTATGDPELDGTVLRVEGVPNSTEATRRALLCSVDHHA